MVTGPKAVVVSISVAESDLAEDSDAGISMVVGTGSGVDAGWLAADDDATAEARTVVEEAAVVSGMVRAVESADVAASSVVCSVVDGVAVVSEPGEEPFGVTGASEASADVCSVVVSCVADVRAAEVSESAEDSGRITPDVDCETSVVLGKSAVADVDVCAGAWAVVVAEAVKASRVVEDGLVVSAEAEASPVVLSEVSAAVVSSPVC